MLIDDKKHLYMYIFVFHLDCVCIMLILKEMMIVLKFDEHFREKSNDALSDRKHQKREVRIRQKPGII